MSLLVVGQLPSSNLPRVNERDEWTVYGSDSCPYTQKVLTYLKQNNLPHTYHSVSREDRPTLTERTGGHSTVPAVYNYGTFVGGSDDFFQRIN